MSSEDEPRIARGAAYAVAAYLFWGLVPLYWKALGDVPPFEVLAHRVIGSALFVAGMVTLARRWPDVASVFRSAKKLRVLAGTTALITTNWALFIWAVQSRHLVEASLGYYVNPLVNVVLGVVLLGERLRRLQVIAVVFAAVGVLWMTLAAGKFPWISLVLASTFALYGLSRKTAPVEALVGLFVETVLATPIAVVYVLLLETSGRGALSTGTVGHSILLALAGPVTALPLLWFAISARLLPLSMLGFFQYLSPTCQFLLALLAFGEPLSASRAGSFVAIWIGLGLFTWDARRVARDAQVADR